MSQEERIANKLINILKALRAKEKEDWEETVKKRGIDNVVPLDKWNLTSGIEFLGLGVNGTCEIRDRSTNGWLVEPNPKKDMLWLVYHQTLKEFDGLDLSANKDLLNFFQQKGQRKVLLQTEDQIKEFCICKL